MSTLALLEGGSSRGHCDSVGEWRLEDDGEGGDGHVDRRQSLRHWGGCESDGVSRCMSEGVREGVYDGVIV